MLGCAKGFMHLVSLWEGCKGLPLNEETRRVTLYLCMTPCHQLWPLTSAFIDVPDGCNVLGEHYNQNRMVKNGACDNVFLYSVQGYRL